MTPKAVPEKELDELFHGPLGTTAEPETGVSARICP